VTGQDAWTRLRRGTGAVALGAAILLGTSGCAWISRASQSAAGDPADSRTPTASDPAISADGRYVAFDSFAGNLAPTAEYGGVFVRDTRANRTEAVSLRANGTVDDFADSPTISDDGRFVAYVSDGDGIVAGGTDRFSQVYVRDRFLATTTRVSTKPNGNQGTDDSDDPSISGNGRWIAFASDSGGLVRNDLNGSTDVFVRDQLTGVNQRISVDAAGGELELGGDSPSIDRDGDMVAFVTGEQLVAADTNVWDDVYVRNLTTSAITLVSGAPGGAAANSGSMQPEISADGRQVAFASAATNLDGLPDANGAFDVFVRDLGSGTTTRVSTSIAGAAAQGRSDQPSISQDGRFVSFESTAADAVAGDTNGMPDAFVRDRTTGKVARLSTDQLGEQLPQGGDAAELSADGTSVTFRSVSPITGQTPSAFAQLYVRATVPSGTPR
jgi:Tol biopolymer transport system component